MCLICSITNMVIFINSISYGWSYAQRSCHCQFWDQMCSFQKSIICRCFAIALMFPMHLRKARNLLCGKLEGGGLERGEHVSSWKLSLFLLMFYQILKQLESYRNTIFFLKGSWEHCERNGPSSQNILYFLQTHFCTKPQHNHKNQQVPTIIIITWLSL